MLLVDALNHIIDDGIEAARLDYAKPQNTKLRFLIAALAAFIVGWGAGVITRPAPMAAEPSPPPALETTVVDLSKCWHPGLQRNASIAMEAGCE